MTQLSLDELPPAKSPSPPPWRIELARSAVEDLAKLKKRDEVLIRAAIREQLTDQPDVRTRRRLPLEDDPENRWELKVIGRYRVFYAMDAAARRVTVLYVRRKDRQTTREILP